MSGSTRARRLLEGYLSIGETPGESERRRGGRRVLWLALIIATLFSLPPTIARFPAGYTWVGVVDTVGLIVPLLLLAVIAVRPTFYVAGVTTMFVVITAENLVDTAMFGGLYPSGLIVLFGLSVATGALLAIGVRAGVIWFVVFLLSVIYAIEIPHWVDPVYTLEDPVGNAAFALIGTGILTAAAMIYFVRQRDRFQRRSDDLLHAILPTQVAAQLKDNPGMIATDFPMASVLFADVVGFTPMSATMSPSELVSLLDELFTTFDGFVRDLGLEKIKTIGDAYMAAAGVPEPKSDHALAIAELALRIREYVAANTVGGRDLSVRIGIDSGPLTAGIIGTQKFSYDLWGDTVNTASRMESEGVPGAIQLSPASYELVREGYVCEPRGLIDVKGKDPMRTYLLVARREDDRRVGP